MLKIILILTFVPLFGPRSGPNLDRPRHDLQSPSACIVKAHLRHAACYQRGASTTDLAETLRQQAACDDQLNADLAECAP